ncbi:MAG: hypothetical protein Q8M31_12970 [Beijerinckiaceae bacterium]|nr:hypothetical protein [Beijerinckiaceae bacterium]
MIGAQRPYVPLRELLLREASGIVESGRIAFENTAAADGDIVDFFIT